MAPPRPRAPYRVSLPIAPNQNRARPITQQSRLFTAKRASRGRARRGLDASIAAWRSTGTIEPADEAWLALARITADALDGAERDTDESRFVIGSLAARHRDVLASLYDRHRIEDDGPSLAELLAAMDNPPDEPAL